ncbi:MAG: DUF3253 domain-containing protein [Pseudomonadota bacterium]
MPSAEEIRAVLLDLAATRGEKSFCPSEAARRLSDDWRKLMPEIRAQAALLQDQGALQATRRGAAIRATDPGGPIRLTRVPRERRT